jgi:Glycosyl hydrolase family 12
MSAMKKLLGPSLVLIVTAVLFSGTSAAAASSAARVCTARNGSACTFGHWIVYNNTWGPTPGKYVIHARSQSNWSVTADQNGGGGCGGCAVEAYESAQWDYNSNARYSSIKYLSSSFSETMPTGSLRKNGVDAEATFDMFINGSDTDEVMVWVDNQGQTPAGSRHGVVVIHGQKFALYVSGGTKSFVLSKNETKGTIDYLAILRWLHDHRMLAASDVLKQFNFGWEVCDTGGVSRTFTVTSLVLHQKF